MKRAFKIILAVIAIIFIVIQIIPRDHNESGRIAVNDITKVYTVPANVSSIFKRSCYDCHSDYTNYPWYAYFHPFRYMMDGHIRQGKKELNFNAFGTYSARKQRSKLRAIGESLEEGSMPLSSYTFIHRSAVLSKQDQTLLMDWVKKQTNSLN